MFTRARCAYVVAIPVIIAMGLGSRHPALPAWMHLYVGDVLWAVMFYLCGRVVWTTRPRLVSLAFALTTTCGIESSQLLHTPWLDHIRSTTIGGLLLGHGFLWSDIIACVFGVCFACLLDTGIQRLWQKDRPRVARE